jgi:epoxyqueuosine reductase
VKSFARQLSFDLVGIAAAEPSRYRQYFRDWLDAGRAGTMEYIGRRFDERVDPQTYVPGAVSVICVAQNYYAELEPVPPGQEKHHAKIARYALGDDYHETMKHRLWQLADRLRAEFPDAVTRTCVDTAPVLERETSARAAIGWVGKNCCVINPQIGSWLLLGEIITTIDLPPDEPQTDRCGTCRRCIDACPTGAITEPYQLDARRCISYLNIEHRDEIPQEFHDAVGPWLYGCDICQDVCPWNGKALQSLDPAMKPRFPTGTLDLREVQNWSPEEYSRNLRGSAMKRVKLPVLQRNARIVARNLE